jgi:hypothetical protein
MSVPAAIISLVNDEPSVLKAEWILKAELTAGQN